MQARGGGSSRHVLIYGPPAAGKLTVAQSLATNYGFKVLDNHLSLDVALRLFDFGTNECWELVDRLRVELLGAAGRAGVDVVSTLVFAHPSDRGHVSRLVRATEDAGALVSFVQLRPRAVLKQRVAGSSRAGTRKVQDVARLARLLDNYDLETPINDDDLSIDNSELSAAEVAALIGRTSQLANNGPPAVPQPEVGGRMFGRKASRSSVVNPRR